MTTATLRNRKRKADYMNLRRKINAVNTHEKLNRLRQVVIRFNDSVKFTPFKEDGTDIMNLWIEKYGELNPEHAYNI